MKKTKLKNKFELNTSQFILSNMCRKGHRRMNSFSMSYKTLKVVNEPADSL